MVAGLAISGLAKAIDVPALPLVDSVVGQPPLNVLVVGRDQNLFVEAYNDASDLDGDGVYDVGFKPAIDYYGYFNTGLCYTYSDANKRFSPSKLASGGKCGGDSWSGNLLNYLAMSRVDVLRKSLYGGMRVGNSAILQRSRVPRDAHAWGKELDSALGGRGALSDYVNTATTIARFSASGDKRSIASWLAGGARIMFVSADDNSGNEPELKIAAASGTTSLLDWVSTEGNAKLGDANHEAMSGLSVRVEACTALDTQAAQAAGKTLACRQYAAGARPIGLLHKYSVDQGMEFALLTGSYDSTSSGGALRVAMRRFADEIDSNGDFKAGGIVKSLDALRINSDGNRSALGNPLAEMYYEAVRYLAGRNKPVYLTSAGTKDTGLGLPFVSAWADPYASRAWCARPYITAIGDAVTSFDTNVPGSAFGDSRTSDIGSLNVSTLAATLWGYEYGSGVTKAIMIGGKAGSEDGLPTGKSVSNFNVRGISPEAPTQQGGFYAAMIAHYARTIPLITATPPSGKSKPTIMSFAVAVSEPTPKIELDFAGKKVGIVPYGKVVSGGSNPLNIVDYYLLPSSTSCTWPDCYTFRVNFDDANVKVDDSSGDYDLDAIVQYTIRKAGSDKVTVNAKTVYSQSGFKNHMGFVITGVVPLADASAASQSAGAYLVVREIEDDGKTADSLNYAAPLPTDKTLTFTVSSTAQVDRLQSPLWYLAKYGGYSDAGGSNPNAFLGKDQWDADNDGIPDAYAAAVNPLKLEQQLGRIFESIQQQSPFLTPAVGNSRALSTEAIEYTGGYDTSDWSGNLIARQYDAVQKKFVTVVWSAAEKLQSDSGRQIIAGVSGESVTAIPFTADELRTRGWLDGLRRTTELVSVADTRLAYLRGSAANEGSSTGMFRQRKRTKLGDILHSRSLYVAPPKAGFSSDTAYQSFYSAYKDRSSMLYVGANDGMLHAFDAASGAEKFAFIPRVFLSKTTGQSALIELSDQGYTHNYYVDGQLSSSDAWADNAWKTLLAGGLRAGGKGIYLLDISNPANLVQSKASQVVQWEFTANDDADLGMTFAKPHILKLNDNNWYVVAPNGYDSTQGKAALFMLPVNRRTAWSSGTYLKLIADASGANGLSDMNYLDINKDGKPDFIYAGDLQGNLWRFDISSSNSSRWSVKRLFRAVGPDNLPQPIVLPPEVSQHPALSSRSMSQPNVMLTFAGGKFIESCDKSSTGCTGQSTTRTLYSVWDFGGDICKRDELLAVTAGYQPETGLPKNRHYFDYGSGSLLSVPVANAACVSSGNRVLTSLDGKQSYNLSGYKLGYYFDLVLPQENIISIEVFGKNRVVFETDYRKTVANSCESEFATYPYDNFNLLGQPLAGAINPPTQTEIDALATALQAKGMTQAAAKKLAAGLGGPGSSSLASMSGLLRRNVFKEGSKCYLSYNGNVSGPFGCGSGRIIKRVSWREVVND